MPAVPEMHRLAVDVHGWMTDRQFADLFAIAQVTPGPNVIIVTLIGYHVAGVAGRVVTTLAMCGPTCLIAYYVGTGLSSASATRAGACDPGRARSGLGRTDRGERPDCRTRRRSRLDRCVITAASFASGYLDAGSPRCVALALAAAWALIGLV